MQSAEPARGVPRVVGGRLPPDARLDARGILALQRGAGNAAVARMAQERLAAQAPIARTAGRSLQRYKVQPMPKIKSQWLRKGKLVDLNCGWYAQLGVVDYHYRKSIRPRLTTTQRRWLEKGGHLRYSAGKGLLGHDISWGFNPARYDAQTGAFTHQAAISTTLQPKPNTPAEWKKALQDRGPLIASKALHYVLVVGVTNRSFLYLDSLTGRSARHDFKLMNWLIDDVHFVSPGQVEFLLEPQLQAAAAATAVVAKPTGDSEETLSDSETTSDSEVSSQSTSSETTSGSETTSESSNDDEESSESYDDAGSGSESYDDAGSGSESDESL